MFDVLREDRVAELGFARMCWAVAFGNRACLTDLPLANLSHLPKGLIEQIRQALVGPLVATGEIVSALIYGVLFTLPALVGECGLPRALLVLTHP